MIADEFQHTAARRRLANLIFNPTAKVWFQHTAARRRLGFSAARQSCNQSFNTQPPEGGWSAQSNLCTEQKGFNTQPPEGGWNICISGIPTVIVSTHSRPKAAGILQILACHQHIVSTHSRPKAAGHGIFQLSMTYPVSTHSRPKAAGRVSYWQRCANPVSTHSRPKAAGYFVFRLTIFSVGFNTQPPEGGWAFPRVSAI